MTFILLILAAYLVCLWCLLRLVRGVDVCRYPGPADCGREECLVCKTWRKRNAK